MKTSGIRTTWSMVKKLLEKYKEKNEYETKEDLGVLLLGFGGGTVNPKSLDDLDELYDIFKALDEILSWKFINYKDDSEFYINYEFNDSSIEFDSIFMLKSKSGQKIIIDIEVKRSHGDYDSVNKKSIEQANKKIEEHLPILFIKEKYTFVVFRFIDGNFVEAIIKNNDRRPRKYTNPDKLKSRFKDSFFHPEGRMLIEENFKKYGIANSIEAIKNGRFTFTKDNDDKWSEIEKFINSDKKIIQIQGGAGSGKTLLALRAFYNIDDSNLLILNQKFFKSFFSKEESKGSKIVTYGDQYFLRNYNSQNKIAIIDEGQRITFEKLKLIIDNYKKVIIFGDEKQVFMRDDRNFGMCKNEIIKYVGKENYEYSKMKVVTRFPAVAGEVLEKISNLSKIILEENTNKKELIHFKINIYNSSSFYLKRWRECLKNEKKISKMYTNYDYKNYSTSSKGIRIGNEVFFCYGFDIHKYSTNKCKDGYIGNTHHAISFDVDNAFIYIPNLEIVEWRGTEKFVFLRKELFIKENTKNNEIDLEINKQNNQIYILLTRATTELNWLIDDLDVYKRIIKIINNNLSNWSRNDYE